MTFPDKDTILRFSAFPHPWFLISSTFYNHLTILFDTFIVEGIVISLYRELKALQTMKVTNANFEDLRKRYWDAVDLLKEKHGYAHFFMNGDLLRNFYNSDRVEDEKIGYASFLLQYYIYLQTAYAEALEFCLSNEVLPEYTLPFRSELGGNALPCFDRVWCEYAPYLISNFFTIDIYLRIYGTIKSGKIYNNRLKEKKWAIKYW